MVNEAGDVTIDFRSRWRSFQDAGGQSRLAAGRPRMIALVGDPDDVISKAQGADDLGGTGQERNDSHRAISAWSVEGGHEWVEQLFLLDRRRRPVPGIDHGPRWQAIQDGANGDDDLGRVAAREIGATDSPGEQGIAGEAIGSEEKADGSLRVPRGVQDPQRDVLEGDGVVVAQWLVDGE